MKEVWIHCTWRSSHKVEAPDDFGDPDNLDDFPDSVVAQIDARGAFLSDWRVVEK